MSKPFPANAFHAVLPAIGHNVSDVVVRSPTETVRTFDLPAGLHVATVGIYFAFLGIMATAFADPRMSIVMGICVVYVSMAFGVPAMWVKMQPDHAARAPSWAQFTRQGVATCTGHLAAREAAIQVLIMPVAILLWGLCLALIVAFL